MENKNSLYGLKRFKEVVGILIKRYFVTGLIIIIPLWLTFFVVNILFNWISNFTFPMLAYFISDKTWAQMMAKAVSFFVSIASICILGFLTNKVLGKSVLNYFEKLINKVPFISTVYSAAKQFVNFLFGKDKNKSFKEVVFVPYPNAGVYCVAFKTGEQTVGNEKYVCAFMPTTPNPTTGFLFLFKEKDIIHTDYTVDQAFQFLISIGVITMDSKSKVDQHELHKKIKEMKKRNLI